MSSIQEGNNSLTNQSLPQVEQNQSNSNRSDSRAESSSTQEENTPPQVENQSNTGSDSDHPDPPSKLWGIQDPFKYAPPKPEGDPWALLLDPLIKKDKAQCDAWKDEVQNLLIFAGLFSAVVTAFILESYKNLQADPNDTIVSLLSQIALQTDRSLNATAVKLEPANPFVPTPSSIRVNVFWFLSLILSLATVVIGIVSLQWLREHQSYDSDLSPRSKYALFNMRADGLKAWHVDKFFTGLPLLLQSALVLFLGGVIDFLHAIGYWAVTIPVMIAISFILMFLIATTVIPCLQVILLSFTLPYDTKKTSNPIVPPRQCPYKSPQSQAIQWIFTFLHQTNALNYLQKISLNVKAFSKHLLAGYPGRFRFVDFGEAKDITSCTNFTLCLLKAFKAQRWAQFDLAWLCIRDAYMRRSFNNDVCSLGFEDNYTFPIYDAVARLLLQRYQKSTAHSAYHCFDEISLMNDVYRDNVPERYLDRLLTNSLGLAEDTSLLDFLDMPSELSFDASDMPDDLTILRQQSLIYFVGAFPTHHQPVIAYRQHRLELYVRLLGYFPKNYSYVDVCANKKIPWCLTVQKNFYDLRINDVVSAEASEIMWHLGAIALSALQDLEPIGRTDPVVFIDRYDLAETMHWVSSAALMHANYSVKGRERELLNRRDFRDLLSSIVLFLEEKMANHVQALKIWAKPDFQHHPCLLFYLAAICCYQFSQATEGHSFHTFCATVQEYKELTIDDGRCDRKIEAGLRSGCLTANSDLFSKRWWDNMYISDLPSNDSTRP
ncbi:hypothetical protein JR316_0010921 [Psilocybe cubensis]|uniref:Uncharacterized protein n=1 Tax=Psilocybe cubensis TaxID=181762 RepID=A0ACB8GPS5_PSICU|nr:hypothetical protein JR316_0010921 [Psilocybe cubensis]KAH9477005.1 hypothetical protein JR316_0010921 [Psilocybe cubensis]